MIYFTTAGQKCNENNVCLFICSPNACNSACLTSESYRMIAIFFNQWSFILWVPAALHIKEHMYMCVLSRFIRVRLCATLWRDRTCIPCISCVPSRFFTVEPTGKTKRTYNQFLFCWKSSWWHESLQALTKQFHQHCKIIQVTDSIQKWLLWGVRCRKPLQLHDLLIAF